MAERIDVSADALLGYVEYLRDLGVFDLYQSGAGEPSADAAAWLAAHAIQAPGSPLKQAAGEPQRQPVAPPAPATRPLSPFEQSRERARRESVSSALPIPISPASAEEPRSRIAAPSPVAAPLAAPANDQSEAAGIHFAEMPAPRCFNDLAPLPAVTIPHGERAAALQAVRTEIGDCTRCPLAYAGRHTIVFADGNPKADLMFVGEGPGADEDETGLPFVGKAGQLLNNMIQAMGLQRAEVYIANIVKCRPPKNRVPEPMEAGTCSQFLLKQIDIVQPKVIVALGGTAATYLLGVKQSLASLRGNWYDVRGARCAVTYHPAFLLRDPRQKGETWKDLQRVMAELKLKPPARA